MKIIGKAISPPQIGYPFYCCIWWILSLSTEPEWRESRLHRLLSIFTQTWKQHAWIKKTIKKNTTNVECKYVDWLFSLYSMRYFILDLNVWVDPPRPVLPLSHWYHVAPHSHSLSSLVSLRCSLVTARPTWILTCVDLSIFSFRCQACQSIPDAKNDHLFIFLWKVLNDIYLLIFDGISDESVIMFWF